MKLLLVAMLIAMSAGCSSVKIIEKNAEGGTLKFRKRGLAADRREDKTMSEADEHCKRYGFKTYKVESEAQDGRFLIVRFKCVN